MRQQLHRREELQQQPFSFAQELTAGIDAGTATMCGFLRRHGLHGRGLWRRECPCDLHQPWGTLAPASALPVSEIYAGGNPAELPAPAVRSAGPSAECRSWSDLYALRGLPSSCPAALLLDGPLTLYRSVMWALEDSLVPQHLVVHLLGPQRELDIWPVFAEVARLLVATMAASTVDLLMIGPDVPQHMDNKAESLGDGFMQLTFRRGLYHDLCGQMQCDSGQPHLIFAPNAGLAAYPSWVPTLRSLPRGVPIVFTDYCEEAALRAASMVKVLTGAPLALPLCVNPFRRPASSQGRDNALPSFSNGFMFGLVRPPP